MPGCGHGDPAGAAQGADGIAGPCQIFEAYVETQLAPTLKPGDMVILDNFSSHKSEKAAAILKERGAWFLVLPPYSPDLNPIEMAFASGRLRLRQPQGPSVKGQSQNHR